MYARCVLTSHGIVEKYSYMLTYTTYLTIIILIFVFFNPQVLSTKSKSGKSTGSAFGSVTSFKSNANANARSGKLANSMYELPTSIPEVGTQGNTGIHSGMGMSGGLGTMGTMGTLGSMGCPGSPGGTGSVGVTIETRRLIEMPKGRSFYHKNRRLNHPIGGSVGSMLAMNRANRYDPPYATNIYETPSTPLTL